MGSQSKLGADFPVKAYKLSENRYTLEDIKASIPSCKVDLAPLYEKPRRKSTVTLEEAKELYPEWYEKRIVQGEPKQKSKKHIKDIFLSFFDNFFLFFFCSIKIMGPTPFR